jgi:benzoate membrane transport protein
MERENAQKSSDGERGSRISTNPVALPGRLAVGSSNSVRRNLRDLPTVLTPSAWMAGLVAVLIAYTGPLVLVFQAARNAGLDQSHLASWIWALTIGSGLTTLLLCLWYRQPIVIAWSIAGSALLVSSLAHHTLPEAVGAYIVAGLAVTILGWSGLFRRMLAAVPEPVVLGMLAGVLLRFGIGLFSALPERPVLVIVMLIAFMALQGWAFRTPTVGALAAGLVVAAITGDLRLEGITPELAIPLWLWPQFTLQALLSLGLPLFVLAVASQNAPGIAVLKSAGYDPPVDGPIIVTGVGSVLTAPLAGHGLNLAALMGAICASPEVHPDLDRRYGAGVAAAIWFVVFGSFGATAAALFAGLPSALVAALAGLAMTPALRSSLAGAMVEPAERQAALFALLLTAADISILGIGAPFWGLVVGVLTSRLLQRLPSS